MQEDMENKSREDAAVVITHQLDADNMTNATTLMATSYTTAISSIHLGKATKKPHCVEM